MVRLPHILAKRAIDAAFSVLDREAAVHVQAHCLASRFGANRLAAKDCRAVLMKLRFRTPGHQELCSGGRFISSNDFVGEFMRHFILAAAMTAAFTGYPALAEEAADPLPTRVEINQATKTFTFIIDNKPVALLDKNGLHVREAIVYGGTLTDAGAVSFDKRIVEMKKEAGHD
ncbi:hypothetical protein [Hyphomicrobium sp. NDB2Meth4]|uniref:hypothetical protein n=1 Tax=Hyphomicrobium sp. NDB2Meth4 TaxID=1892846 RepID=UPI001114DFF0|nr:hypothetical protein [Hyphomicrobium sp. NDB2Meth4]